MVFLIIILFYITSCYSYDIYVPKSSNKWYVVGTADKFKINTPNKIILKNLPITIWKNEHHQYSAVFDVCPHRGASLSKGRIDRKTGCIVCPYHTFKFNSHGRLIQTPGSDTIRTNDKFILKTDVPYFDVIEKNGWIFLKNEPKYEIALTECDVWVEPEAYDPTYHCVYLEKDFKVDARTLTENSLDILHISEVHTFGNPKRPLPYSDKIEKINDDHYKITYEYEAGEESIPKKIFGEDHLVIENEFKLPHYTIARVKFGLFVNTIVTSAHPINDTYTKLYVKAYRNNFILSPFKEIMDVVTKYQMEKTLKEDQRVIESIDFANRDGKYVTKYDRLLTEYRSLMNE